MEVVTWEEVNPGLAANVRGDTAFMNVLVIIIVILVSMGIASAQLTAILERRRELAVLSALGMKPHQVVGLVLLEALFVGLGGAVAACGIGGSVAYWLAVKGVDFGAMMNADLAFENVLFEPHMYAEFGPWIIPYALLVSTAVTVVASLYPAWLAVRVQPAEALRTV